MKTIIKSIPLIFLILIGCETSEESNLNSTNLTSLNEALLQPNNGYLIHNDKTLIFTKEGHTQKFINNKLAYNFSFENEVQFNLKSKFNAASKQDIVVENPNYEEYFILSNIQAIDDDIIEFDVEISSGIQLNSLLLHGYSIDEFTDATLTSNCPQCYIGLVLAVIEAVIEISDDDIDSNCRAAIDACEAGGGLANVKITSDWLGTTSCEVTCATQD